MGKSLNGDLRILSAWYYEYKKIPAVAIIAPAVLGRKAYTLLFLKRCCILHFPQKVLKFGDISDQGLRWGRGGCKFWSPWTESPASCSLIFITKKKKSSSIQLSLYSRERGVFIIQSFLSLLQLDRSISSTLSCTLSTSASTGTISS